MTPKTVMGLGAVTLVAVIAAVVSVSTHRTSATDSVEEPVFTGLEDKVNAAATLTVRTADESVSIQRSDGHWAIAEKKGFPADSEMVRRVLIQLSQLRLMERKTEMPERYPRIEVSDLDAEDAKSTLLTVKSGSGDVLADLIVGKTKNGLAGATGKGVYLRKAGEKQSWLARGELDLRKGVNAWLAKGIVDVGGDRIKRITSTRADGAVTVFTKATPEDKTFEIGGLPDGKAAKEDEIKDLGEVLSDLRLTNVAPASDKVLTDDKIVQAEVVTFDGLVVNIDMEETEDGIWARFEASSGGSGAETAKEADDINARVKGWVYQIPDFKVRPLLKSPEELVAS